ncbi:Cap15 family cyclic dinucleotide receptor domain-containing protein [Flectobacillus rivi]|uniref:CD-NTase-associated protein 15 domain-containing protein n=1 Tax=Flectobacillus rivi TaxID=2984209 RepID=A0ABT6YZN0_9BACT|nr:hypothetical protein [Flectobacillus rivi]MDI9874298.1 hypothetical protein [Flectobacillus rivi]
MRIGHYNVAKLVPFIIIELMIISSLPKFIGTQLVKFNFSSELIEFLKILSPTTIIVGTLYVINNFLWKYPVINPFLIDVPVIEGSYEGLIQIEDLSDLNNSDSSSVTVDIRQTGTSTYITLSSLKGSDSESKVAHFVEENGKWSLIFYYSNKNSKIPGNINRYEGAANWKIQMEKCKKIKIVGRFFTDETRKTYGTVELEKVD